MPNRAVSVFYVYNSRRGFSNARHNDDHTHTKSTRLKRVSESRSVITFHDDRYGVSVGFNEPTKRTRRNLRRHGKAVRDSKQKSLN